MTTPPAPARLRRLTAAPPPAPDRQLLAAFLAERSQAAFAELVRRHGPLVYGVCRRVLGHAQDAEDAFQATFLVLARKAGTVTRTDTLSPWLHAVAVRTARELRHMRDRRRKRETTLGGGPDTPGPGGTHDPKGPLAADPDLAAALDEELARLPDHYRRAVILCELEGRPRRAAAAELGIPEGTLSSRLAAAKKKLADRLARRGITAGGAAVAAALATDAAARVPGGLLTDAVRLAVDGPGGAAVAASAAGRAADGVVKALFVAKLKGVAVAVGLAVAGLGGLALAPAGAGDGPPATAAAPTPAELVRRLGSPAFADREAAARELRTLGPAAKPAVAAGVNDPDPEVARRCRELIDRWRGDSRRRLAEAARTADPAVPLDHPVWERFRAVAGDDAAARRLFAEVIGDSTRFKTLDAAVADPLAAPGLYQAVLTDVVTRTGNLIAAKVGANRVLGANTSRPSPPASTAGELGFVLFLGTFPGGEQIRGIGQHNSDADLFRRVVNHDYTLTPQPDGRPPTDRERADAGRVRPALLRVAGKWLTARRDAAVVFESLTEIYKHNHADAGPLAVAVAADPTRPADERRLALFAAGWVGHRAGPQQAPERAAILAALRPLRADASVLRQTADGTLQARDAAAGIALVIAGHDPAAAGFPPAGQDRFRQYPFDPDRFALPDDATRVKVLAAAAALDPPAPDPEAEKLVKQLGSPTFADREAAEKRLKALGPRAKPAVKAGLTSPDPEVARRAAAVLDAIRRDQFRPRFTKLLGDDADTRALFDAILSVPRNAELIEAAEEQPTTAAKLYADRLAELDARVTDRSKPNQVIFHPQLVTAADMAGFFYLGTFPGATADGAPNHFVMYFRDMWQNPGYPFSAALAGGPLKVGCRRLLAKWTETRTDPAELTRGLNGALAFGVADVVPFAKTYARKAWPTRPNSDPEPLLLALTVVGKLGTRDDLPFLLQFADDRTVVRQTFISQPGDETRPPTEFRPGKDSALELRDVAVVAALVLCGQSRERIDEYGFFVSRYDPRPAGTPLPPVGRRRWADDPLTVGDLGFVRDEDRGAGHKKARAWLDAQLKPAPPAKGADKPPPPAAAEAEGLVKQLGSPTFADREAADRKLRDLGVKAKPAVKAAMTNPDPETARRAVSIWAAIRNTEMLAFVERYKADTTGTAVFDHPVWVRYKGVAGDTRASRQLFAEMVGDPDRARLLARVTEDPEQAGDAYAGEVMRLSDRVLESQEADKKKAEPGPGEQLKLGEFAAAIFLGTFDRTGFRPDPTVDLLANVREGTLFNVEPSWMTVATGPLGPVVRRLAAAWLGRRTNPEEIDWMLGQGFALTDFPEAYPVARRVAADADLPAKCRSAAILYLARYGGAAELPAIATFFDVADAVYTGAEFPGGKMTVEVRDVAVRAAVQLHGRDPADFGFPPPAALGFTNLKSWKQASPGLKYSRPVSGFFSDADRAAAHKKAREWLAAQPKPVEKK